MVMERHCIIGYEILTRDAADIFGPGSVPDSASTDQRDADHDLLQMAASIALCHHERWDGQGYPRGLKGNQIPLAARIVALADVYDALTSDRPYKYALSQEQTVEVLEGGPGSHFDPEVYAAFEKLTKQFRAIRNRLSDEPCVHSVP